MSHECHTESNQSADQHRIHLIPSWLPTMNILTATSTSLLIIVMGSMRVSLSFRFASGISSILPDGFANKMNKIRPRPAFLSPIRNARDGSLSPHPIHHTLVTRSMVSRRTDATNTTTPDTTDAFAGTGVIPPEFIKSYSVRGVGKRSVVEMHTNTGHGLYTDVPKTMGGTDTAPQPVETLLASLLGCTQATALFVGRHMTPRVLIDRLEMNLTADRDERGALELPIDIVPSIDARLQRITGTIRVYTKEKKELSEEELSLLSHQTELRCPVANMMVASGCAIDVIWVNGREDEC